MTPKFREQMKEEGETTLRKIEEDLKKIEEETVKYIASISLQNPQQASTLSQQIEAEKEKLRKTKNQLEDKIAELQEVKDGTEIPFQTYDGFVEVNIGDNLHNLMTRAVIVIRDWQVVEIRES